MTEIFLSYSSKDRERVQAIHHGLSAYGFDVFWDQAVPAGTNWDTWIRQHLTRSKCALAFWSANSVLSDNVVHEATVAKQQGKLLPVLLDALTADQFPMGLYTVQAANFSAWTGDVRDTSFQQLLAELESKLTPLWMRRTIDRLEAELVAERARREATERRDRTLQQQISKEAEAQIEIIRERNQILAAVDAKEAELRAVQKALDEARQEAIELTVRLKAANERVSTPPATGPAAPHANGTAQDEATPPDMTSGSKPGAPPADASPESLLWHLASRPDHAFGQDLWMKKDYLEKYTAQFPRGSHLATARTEARRLEEIISWRAAEQSGRRGDLQAFIERYPTSQYSAAARRLLGSKWF